MVDSPFNRNSRPRPRHDLELLRTTVQIAEPVANRHARPPEGWGEGLFEPEENSTNKCPMALRDGLCASRTRLETGPSRPPWRTGPRFSPSQPRGSITSELEILIASLGFAVTLTTMRWGVCWDS